MSMDFGDPVYVDELPAGASKAGRKGNVEAVRTWLSRIEPNKGWAELPSPDDKGHVPGRVTAVRKIAVPMGITVKTVSLESGKRYRIYARPDLPGEATNGDAATDTAADATPDATPDAATPASGKANSRK